MVFVDYGGYKLAIKIACQGVFFQGYAIAFAHRFLGFWSVNSDEIGGRAPLDRATCYALVEVMAGGDRGI